jgi:prefoldin subunit 5
LADTLKASLKQAANMAQKKMLTLSFTPAIKALDDRINGYNAELDALDDQIHNLDSFIKNNKSIVRNIKKRKNEDPTTQPE